MYSEKKKKTGLTSLNGYFEIKRAWEMCINEFEFTGSKRAGIKTSRA